MSNCVKAEDLLLSVDSDQIDDDGYVLLEDDEFASPKEFALSDKAKVVKEFALSEKAKAAPSPLPESYDFFVDFMGDEGNCIKSLGYGDQGSVI